MEGGIENRPTTTTTTTTTPTTTPVTIIQTGLHAFPSSKKNDDESPTTRQNIVVVLCLTIPRWFLHIRILAMTKRRQIWSISLLALLGITISTFVPFRPRVIKVTADDSHKLTNIPQNRRIVQLGPIFGRQRKNNEVWILLRGSGDVTNVTSVQSPLPPLGARKLLEEDDLSHQKKSDTTRKKTKGGPTYTSDMAKPLETETCEAQYDWQRHHHPNCNHLMEQDWTRVGLVYRRGHSYVRFLAHGYFRDVWKLQAGPEKTALKTLRYKHDVNGRHFDRHRRDAVTMEQLTSSPWVVDIYGFCGNSGIFEYADGGSLEDNIFYDDDDGKKEWSSSDKVVVLSQTARVRNTNFPCLRRAYHNAVKGFRSHDDRHVVICSGHEQGVKLSSLHSVKL